MARVPYPKRDEYPSAYLAAYDRMLRELSAHPSFAAVGLTSRFQMVFSGSGPVEIDGKVYANKKDRPNANFEQVTGSFFAVTGQRILDGRTFTDEDMDSRLPVAIVNAAFARKHFGTDSAVGRRFRTMDGNTEQPGPWRTIVGVASTIRMLGPFNNPNVDESGFYVPFYSSVNGPVQAAPFANQFATVIVRPKPGLRADTLAPVLQREVSKVDPNLPLTARSVAWACAVGFHHVDWNHRSTSVGYWLAADRQGRGAPDRDKRPGRRRSAQASPWQRGIQGPSRHR